MPVIMHQNMPGQNVKGILLIFRVYRRLFPDDIIRTLKELELTGPAARELIECGFNAHAGGCIRFFLALTGKVRDKLGSILIHEAFNSFYQHGLHLSQMAEVFRNRPETFTPSFIQFAFRNGQDKLDSILGDRPSASNKSGMSCIFTLLSYTTLSRRNGGGLLPTVCRRAVGE